MAKHIFASKKIAVDIKFVAEKGIDDKEAYYFTEMDGHMVHGTLGLDKETGEKKFNALVKKYGEVTQLTETI